jgi:hypothetical protein
MALSGLLQHRVEHLHDEALLRLRQCRDLFQLLLQLRRGAALAGALGRRADQRFDADAELVSQGRQRAGQQAQAAGLVVGQGLLGYAGNPPAD